MFENDSYEEIMIPFKDIKEGYSYTVARVIDNGNCVELHYNNHKATIEYAIRISEDEWQGRVEEIDWFNINLSEDYVLTRLNYLFDEEFSDRSLTDSQAEELNLIDKILYNHKVYDIELSYNINNDIVAFDDQNFWIGEDFYNFLFNELFVENKDGSIDLIAPDDLKKLKDFRAKQSKIDSKNTIEIYKSLPEFYKKDLEKFLICHGIYETFPEIDDEDGAIIYEFCLKNINENTNVLRLSNYITDEFTKGNISLEELKNLGNKDLSELSFYDNLNHFLPIKNEKDCDEIEK